MKATAHLTVADDAQLTITLQMSVRDAKRLRAELVTDSKPRYWTYPLDRVVEILRDSIGAAEASHAAVIGDEPAPRT